MRSNRSAVALCLDSVGSFIGSKRIGFYAPSTNSDVRRLASFILVRLAFACAFAILMGGVAADAQTLPPQTAEDQMGAQPFQSYHGGDIDHVGLANGTLSLDFPFLSYPQRGQLQLDFHLYYNNQPQHLAEFCFAQPVPPEPQCFYEWGYTPDPTVLPLEKGDVFVGWAQQVGISATSMKVVLNSGLQDQITEFYERWSVQTADGATHPLGNLGTQSMVAACPGCTDPLLESVGTGPWESLDSTGWRVNGVLSASQTTFSNGPGSGIVDSEGVVAGVQDPNGNVISVSGATAFPSSFTDTVGRQIPGPPTAKSASNASTSLCPSGMLPVSSAVSWSVPGANGGASTYIFCYVSVTINDGPGLANTLIGQPTSLTKLQSIVLPDGHSWSFQYNDPGDGSTNSKGVINYGTLTQITLPTGGAISYTYTTTGIQTGGCQNGGRWIASRTENANDGTGAHTWTYSYGLTASSVSTTLTDPLGGYSVHTFNSLSGAACPAYETQAQYFQNGGVLLKTINTSYSFTAGGAASNVNGPSNVVPIQITTVWPNGKTATVNKSYDQGFTYTNFLGNGGNAGIYGKELAESASDFGNNAAGPTLRTVNTSYLALSNSNYLAANLLDLVSSKTVIDGNGCKQAETDYTYDESSYLTSYPVLCRQELTERPRIPCEAIRRRSRSNSFLLIHARLQRNPALPATLTGTTQA